MTRIPAFNRRIIVLATTVLLLTAIMTVPLLTETTGSYAAGNKPTWPQPFPWSLPAANATGDYIADSYDDVGAGHVFEPVSHQRLIDILRSGGDHYIVFGGPEHATSQTAAGAIQAAASATGGKVNRIYHFDPFVDGYQLDITKNDGRFIGADGTAAWQLWTRITQLLGTAAPISGYTSKDTLLFLYNRDAPSKIRAWYSLTEAEIPGFGDGSSARGAIAKVFRGDNAATGSEPFIAGAAPADFDFFRSVYNAAATWNNRGAASAAKTGWERTELFTEADRAGFALREVTFPELLNILRSPGEQFIFFGASWCANSQAVVSALQKKAKQLGKTIHVYDTTLGNQLNYDGAGAVTSALTAASGFNTRNTLDETLTFHRSSYVYGELVRILGDFDTENQSKAKVSGSGYDISYYPDGNLSGAPTNIPSWQSGDPRQKNAIRLQLPFFFSWNKDASGRKATRQWLHANTGGSAGTPVGTFQEYMLQYTWVVATEKAQAAPGNPSTDNIRPVDFAAEAIGELDYVLSGQRPPRSFVSAPAPVIRGKAVVNQTLTAQIGSWQPAASFGYQWYADGKAISAATRSTLKLKTAQAGKKITVAVSGKASGYTTLTKKSKATAKVLRVFQKQPAPVILGTARAGKTLKVKVGVWKPKAKYTYQWYAGGKAIKGAKKATLKLKKAEKGKKITVAVTAKKAGYATVTKKSKATKKVK